MKISERGQITIPKKMREKFGLFPDSDVIVEPAENGVLVRPVNSRREQVEQWLVRAVGSGNGKYTTDEIMAMTRGED